MPPHPHKDQAEILIDAINGLREDLGELRTEVHDLSKKFAYFEGVDEGRQSRETLNKRDVETSNRILSQVIKMPAFWVTLGIVCISLIIVLGAAGALGPAIIEAIHQAKK